MRTYCCVCLVLIFTACSQEKKPTGIMGDEAFVSLLTDIRIAEASYGLTFNRRDTLRASMAAVYDSIFVAHGTSKVPFLEAYQYYSKSTEGMLKLEDRIMEKLSTLQAEKELELKDRPAYEVDSLRPKALPQ